MTPISRRTFVRHTATTAAALTQFPGLLQGAQEGPIRMGLIGCGWYGMVDLRAALKAGGVECVALCDVDSDHLSKSAEEVEKLQGKRPQTFKHYEELLQADSLQALIIATPPHWHALQLIAALKRGLDVYCEKPLCYDLREGRAMVDAVQRSGRIVQIGFQRRQNKAFQAVRQRVQSGQAGRIVCVDAHIHYNAGPKDASPQEPPASLDWDLWCGPAPRIPYSPQVGHFNWRLEKTTGHGHLVDWGIHLIDATRVILNEDMPKSVAAVGGLYYWKDKITTPDILTAHFEFATCPVTWSHRIWGAEEYTPALANGIFFYGEKETLFVTDDHWEILPRGKGKEREVHDAKTDAGLLHMQDFLEAVRIRRPPVCLAPDAFASTATVKLAMIAYESASKIQWDAEKEQIPANPEASRLLKRDYRAPWRHPADAA